MQGADAAHRRDIIEAENGGKVPPALDEPSDTGIADLGGVRVFLKMNGQLVAHFKAQFTGCLQRGSPANVGVGTERLTLHEGDLAVAKLIEMMKGELGGKLMIEYDVRHPGQLRMPCNQHRRQWKRRIKMRVDRQDAVYTTRPKQIGIGRDQVLLVPVMDREVEIAFTYQQITDAAQNLGVVTLAELRQKHSNRLHALALQRSGNHAGLVVELRGGCFDALTRCCRNGPSWRIIQHK